MIEFNKNTVRSRYSYLFVLLIAFCPLLEGTIRVVSLGFLFTGIVSWAYRKDMNHHFKHLKAKRGETKSCS